MKFSDAIKTLCVCGCVFGSMCEDVRGVNLHKDECSLICGAGREAAEMSDLWTYDENTGTLEIINQHIDYGPFSALYDISNVFTLTIENCTCRNFGTLVEAFNSTLESVTIRHCGLVAKDVFDVFRGLDPYMQYCVDLSYNKLGETEDEFEKMLNRVVFGTFCLDTFNLSGNNFSYGFKTRIGSRCSSVVF